MAKKWIQKTGMEKGALHRHLNVPEGQKIPEEKIRAAANSKNPKIAKEAHLAMTLKGLHHTKEKKKHVNVRSLRNKMYGEKKQETK